MINIGDYVKRKSYNADILFEVINIENKEATLKGVDIRLLADAPISDLIYVEKEKVRNEEETLNFIDNIDRSEFFYMPGTILHIDSDENYIQKCTKYYEKNKVKAITKCIQEEDMPKEVLKLLKEYKPNILVLTGHDAYYRKRNRKDLYKNSKYFINAVKEARKYEEDLDKLIIIAGACQSNYEELIKNKASFASSPKRINIHALDPAIIATYLSLYDKNKEINIKELLSKTTFKEDGIGGIEIRGTMYKGYPKIKVNQWI